MPILNWLNRDKTIKEFAKAPYRLLKAKDEYSYGDKNAENMIIQGDNLDGLKALLPYYAGKVKCIFIDPPYNTKSAFEHYDDNLEHTKWLEMIYPRLELLRELLSENGSIWATIDDNESHYLKVIMDEIFGRRNFIIQSTIQRGAATGHKAINPTPVQVCDYMLTYAKNKSIWKYKPVYQERSYDKAYSKFIDNYEDNFEKWKFITLKEALKKYSISLEGALKKFPERIIRFAQPNYDGVGQDTRDLIDQSKKDHKKVYKLLRENFSDIFLFKGDRILFYKDKMREVDGKLVTAELVTNNWIDMNYQGIAKEGSVVFKRSKKPEAQVKRVLEMATNENDLVLDSFLGSGTTAAVAHKMNRRYIGIEMGEHAKTHCVERLKKVVDGEQGGISKSVNWQGGGGFRFYELGEAIFNDQGKINKNIKFEHLAAHIWFSETKTPFIKKDQNNPYSPFLGIHQGVAYYLLYNGILGDKRPHGGNVLTSKILATLEEIKTENFTGAKVIYGETSRIGPAKLLSKKITFKQTPYDIKSR